MLETPLGVQRLRLHAPTAGGAGLILVREVRSHMPPSVTTAKKEILPFLTHERTLSALC